MSESVGSRPAQLRIVDDLRRRIDSGELAPGAALPSYRALMVQFSVSTQTVQRAIGILMSEGVVESRHGKGVFVRPTPELVSRVQRALDDGDPAGCTPVMTGLLQHRPPGDIAAALGLEADEDAISRQTHWVNDRGHGFAEIHNLYYPPHVARGTAPFEHGPPVSGLIADLRHLGHAPHHATEVVQTRMPTPDEAKMLDLSAGVPVFRTVRSILAEDERVLAVLDIVMSGGRHQLLYKLPIHD